MANEVEDKKDKDKVKNKGFSNLIPSTAGGHQLTREEQKAGGRASVIARRKKKDFREACLALLETEMTDTEGNLVTGYDVVVSSLFTQAKAGNVKAFEALRDTAGQKPVEKLVVSDVDPSVINEVENMVAGATAADTTAADTTAADCIDVTDDASASARNDASFPPPAQVAGIVSDEKPATKTRKRTTKKKTQTETNDSPFFDLGDDDS